VQLIQQCHFNDFTDGFAFKKVQYITHKLICLDFIKD
jgi:hypothetical protein